MALKLTPSQTISLDRLAPAPFFELSLGRPLDTLKESLNRLGQFEPVLAALETPAPATLTVICGNRRLQALRELGHHQALVIVAEVPSAQLLELALEGNQARGFNQAEKIKAVTAWAAENQPFPLARLSQLLGEPLGPKQLAAYKIAADLPHDFLEELSPEPFDLGDYVELAAQSSRQQARALCGLWLRFALSRQKRRQVTELIGDIARRENLTPQEVIVGPEVQAAGALVERSGKPQAGEWLRLALLKRRQPQLSLWQERRQQLLKKLPHEPGLRITWDQSLEDPALKLELTTTSPAQFEKQILFLGRLKSEPSWADLFEPLQAEAPLTPLKY